LRKGNPKKVSGPAAVIAYENADSDRKAAYSNYIKLWEQQFGNVSVNCDNADLQAWYEKNNYK